MRSAKPAYEDSVSQVAKKINASAPRNNVPNQDPFLLSIHGAVSSLRIASKGQIDIAVNEIVATVVCAAECCATLGSGVNATAMIATPPMPSAMRPGVAALRKPLAEMMWHKPVSTNTAVMKTFVGASLAASSLMVWRIGSYADHDASAIVQPPIKMMGAKALEYLARVAMSLISLKCKGIEGSPLFD